MSDDQTRYTGEYQRQLLAQIKNVLTEACGRQQAIDRECEERLAVAEQTFHQEEQRRADEYKQEHEALEARYLEKLATARSAFDTRFDEMSDRKQQSLERLDRELQDEVESIKREWEIAKTQAEARWEHLEQELKQQWKAQKTECEVLAAQLQQFQQALPLVAQRHCLVRLLAQIGAQTTNRSKPTESLPDTLQELTQLLDRLCRPWYCRFLAEGWPVIIWLFGTLALIYPVGRFFDWSPLPWSAVTVFLGASLALLSRQVCILLARRHGKSVLSELCGALRDGERQRDSLRKKIDDHHRRRLTESRQQDQHDRQQSDEKFDCQIRAAQGRVALERRNISRTTSEQLRELEAQWEEGTQAIRTRYLPKLESQEREFHSQCQLARSRHDESLDNIRREHEKKWTSLERDWHQSWTRFGGSLADMQDYAHKATANWDSVDWQQWSGPAAPPLAIRFGQTDVALTAFGIPLPDSPRLPLPTQPLQFPAFLNLADTPSTVILSSGDRHAELSQLMRVVMLRYLTSLPPGKLRMTIIDPVSLGQDFAAFMHLADYDQRLVTDRIWTESVHIQQRLSDLTEHMENVIQKYLRNEFATIEDYNRAAGEVAEPYQLVVVANFPANFNEDAARRLLSIASSGPRCGVFMLVGVDTTCKLPRNFKLEDLQQHAQTLLWDGTRIRWQHKALQPFPLAFDALPNDAAVNGAVRAVGRLAQDGGRVEVPFRIVAPPQSDWWTHDSRGAIDVAIGRAGATKLQYLRLGRGTAQHVLIAGKTGSGKSTLMHAIIVNLALHYSPDELHFYLIDFKKGVEFKAYAQHRLPHARVIAIESEREFGLSVLQRLDNELRRRGDLFRQQGAQDLAAWRDSQPESTLPRILLVIDEFQEFFVRDDTVAQEAALLLDRLVRQGRAFGIHVLLGSQTLSGAYSLARSTIGQMAVRIALQCGEGDAHLILSEENDAARLLSRPGQAIYNDANGLFTGNHPFQVVWLHDEQRVECLRQIRDLAEQRAFDLSSPVVFEGNTDADASQNDLLHKALQTVPSTEIPLAPQAWLGAPIAIKAPPAAVFRRQHGGNLLLVGSQSEAICGMMIHALISLAAFTAQSSAQNEKGSRYFVLDGSMPQSPEQLHWQQMRDLPLSMEFVRDEPIAPLIGQWTDELNLRQQSPQYMAAPWFLFIHQLDRFRDLKRNEQDYSFSFSEESAAPTCAQQFATILRDGPLVGLHTIVSTDSFGNLSRWLDRQTIQQLPLRVLMQMSAGDSSNLMDSPEAGKIGLHRAIFYREELGTMEKLRPYGLPSRPWLEWVTQCLRRRADGVTV